MTYIEAMEQSVVCEKIWSRDVADLGWATICLRRRDAALPAIERRHAHGGAPRSPAVQLTKQSQTEKANEFNAAVMKGVFSRVRACFMASHRAPRFGRTKPETSMISISFRTLAPPCCPSAGKCSNLPRRIMT
jgi:hypothetical protein